MNTIGARPPADVIDQVCIYCNTVGPRSVTPGRRADGAWADIARHHAPGCPWVTARGSSLELDVIEGGKQ